MSDFLTTLKAEVARMQVAHPERLGELARATALILHGQVLPSDDDPETGQVLSSDGEKRYSVNGTCDCQAGQHGKGCKHLQAWKLYQYIARKVEAVAEAVPPPALPEAPASVNCHLTLAGRQVQLTLRDTDETRLLARLTEVLAQYPVPAPTAQPEGWCGLHQVQMRLNRGKDGKSDWYSHRTRELQWCKGK